MGHFEKRAAQRIHLEMPVYIGNEKSVTRDVSKDGIYFLSDHSLVKGGTLNFSLDFAYAMPGRHVKLGFQGEVIRVDQRNGQCGIAAKIKDLQYIH